MQDDEMKAEKRRTNNEKIVPDLNELEISSLGLYHYLGLLYVQ